MGKGFIWTSSVNDGEGVHLDFLREPSPPPPHMHAVHTMICENRWNEHLSVYYWDQEVQIWILNKDLIVDDIVTTQI
jgi:hypothetical protein